MKNLATRAWLALFFLALVMGLLLFVAAGTVRYWHAWVYLAIFYSAAALTTRYLVRNDPALLERRMSGGPLYLLGTPLALGSYYGFLALVATLPFLIWRLFDEERFLGESLPGYREYQQKVRYRLLPRIW